jgi:acyl carrier protein
MQEKIIDIMKRVFELDHIDESIAQNDVAKWDSIGHLNLIVDLEEEFGISFEPEEIAEMKNLKIIAETVEKKLK